MCGKVGLGVQPGWGLSATRQVGTRVRGISAMKARARGMIIADAATLVGGGSGLHEEHHSIISSIDRTSLHDLCPAAAMSALLFQRTKSTHFGQTGCFSRSSPMSDGSLAQPKQARLSATPEGTPATSAAGGAAAAAGGADVATAENGHCARWACRLDGPEVLSAGAHACPASS